MTKRGPKRKPTALKLATGTHRKTRDGDPAKEPKPKVDSKLKPPEFLGVHGRKVWNEHAPQLIAVGLLSVIDRHTFGVLCLAFEDLHEARKVIKKEGALLVGKSGNRYRNPWLDIRSSAEKTIGKFAPLFCMSPASRSGMQIEAASIGKLELNEKSSRLA